MRPVVGRGSGPEDFFWRGPELEAGRDEEGMDPLFGAEEDGEGRDLEEVGST